jgi:TM2 domain-containing membrane protein YozV
MAKKDATGKNPEKTSAENLKDGVKKVKDDLVEGTEKAAKNTANKAEKVMDEAIEETKVVGDDIADGFKKAAEKIKSGAKELADDLGIDTDDIKENLNKAADKVKSGTKDILKDIDEGTKGIQEETKSTVNEFTKGAKDAYNELSGQKSNKKVIAGVLAIIFGSLGAHKFVLGYNKEGLIMLGITVITSIFTFGVGAWLMAVVGLIEGVIYLTKSDADFYKTYQENTKPWF